MKRNRRIFFIVMCCVFALSTVANAAAPWVKKTIGVYYCDIRVLVDGVPMTYRTVNGTKVEPFIYNGVAYMPMRDLSNALGKEHLWDGSTNTIYIGQTPGDTYLLDVCPPYEYSYFDTPATFTMMGNTYANGFTMTSGYNNNEGFALFNLNGQYSSLEFELGHIDGSRMRGGTIDIYLDGAYSQTIDLSAEMIVTHNKIPLKNALQLKFVSHGLNSAAYGASNYGFANAILK